jgi:hypothetical protein
VPGDPADVGRAPVDVGVGLEVEDAPVGIGAADEVAGGGVQDAFRLAGAAGGVDDVERVLGVERLRLVLDRLPPDELVPLHVPGVVPGDVLSGTAYDQHRADVRARGDGLVDGRLQR